MSMSLEFNVDDLDALMRRVVEQIAPVTLRRMESAAAVVYDEAYAKWPIKTGKSREQLYTKTKITPEGVEIVIGNKAPYAYMIKQKSRTRHIAAGVLFDTRKGTRVVTVLITRPWRKQWNKMSDALLAEYDAQLGR